MRGRGQVGVLGLGLGSGSGLGLGLGLGFGFGLGLGLSSYPSPRTSMCTSRTARRASKPAPVTSTSSQLGCRLFMTSFDLPRRVTWPVALVAWGDKQLT